MAALGLVECPWLPSTLAGVSGPVAGTRRRGVTVYGDLLFPDEFGELLAEGRGEPRGISFVFGVEVDAGEEPPDDTLPFLAEEDAGELVRG